MSTLRRYVFREVLGMLGASLLLFGMLPLTSRALELGELLVGGGWGSVGLLALLVPSVLPFALPLSLLLAVLLVVGRMNQEGEVAALRAAGVSPRRLLAPVLIASICCAGLSAWTSAQLTPWAASRLAELASRATLHALRALRPGFNQRVPHVVLYAERAEGGRLQRVFLCDLRSDPPLLVTAQEASVGVQGGDAVLVLRRGEMHRVEGDAYWRTAFGVYRLRVHPRRPRRLEGEGLWELWRRGDRLRFHQRLCLCLSPLVLGVLGLELGLLAHRAYRSHGLLCCFGVAAAFYLAHSGGQALVSAGLGPAWLGGWLPFALLGAAALLLSGTLR